MFKDAQVASKQKKINTRVNHNNRRASKTLVELSIGIIGIIGVMLAQITSGNSENSHFGDNAVVSHLNVAHQVTDKALVKAQDLTVSPITLKADWINILL